MQKMAFIIVLGVLLCVGLVYLSFDSSPTWNSPAAREVEVLEKWELPDILEEVSGIFLLENNRMACVQDEQGVIYIFDLNTSSIEKKINFADIGDFEGLTIVGSTAYILRSDGIIFEVPEYDSGSPKTIQHDLNLPANYDFEGLTHDEVNNRLLLAMKEKAGKEFKPVFGFDLATQQLQKEPVYKIHFNDPVFEILERKRSDKIIKPSEIKVHPITGEIYILEAENPQLLILDPSGKAKTLHVFKEEQFPQPEGMDINSNGDIYISNEANKAPANILKIKLPD